MGPLMEISVQAWRLREAARSAVEVGNFGRARGLAAEAQNMQPTPEGESLQWLSLWLARHENI